MAGTYIPPASTEFAVLVEKEARILQPQATDFLRKQAAMSPQLLHYECGSTTLPK